jgi:uncharacterized membrane protein
MRDSRRHSALIRWPHAAAALLGLWLVSSPFVLGHFDALAMQDFARDVTAERGLFDPATRGLLSGINAIAIGILIVATSTLALLGRFAWAPWATAALGVWLLLAPLVLWAPTFALYLNDTVVGAAVIALVTVIARLPGTDPAALADPTDIPPGWTYAPSSLPQRLPIVVLALICVAFAVPLTAYQLGHIAGVPEPFFAGEGALNGTETILLSDVSMAWPVPDAGLGVVAYIFEVLLGLQGDRRRWRTSPWTVALFGAIVVPLGVISIYFIIIQPILIGTYCTFCLITAGAMLIMIPFAVPEVTATLQFLWRSRRAGRPLIATFFRGGQIAGSRVGEGRPIEEPVVSWTLAEMVRGVTLPLNLLLAAAIGALLMLSPLALGRDAGLIDTLHLVGSLAITISVIAMAEPVRGLRWLGVPLGLWLIFAPWAPWQAADVGIAATVIAVAGGALLVLLAIPHGERSEERYGRWRAATA